MGYLACRFIGDVSYMQFSTRYLSAQTYENMISVFILYFFTFDIHDTSQRLNYFVTKAYTSPDYFYDFF